jgi:cell division septum initiation protein DivIVA
VKTAKYRKQCFDQIEPTLNENKELAAKVDRLREKLKAAEKEKVELETSRRNAVIQLNQKENERMSKLSRHNSPSTKKCYEYILLY